MKKKQIIDLILSHYEDDPRLFFNTTLEILKEFKKDGSEELVAYVTDILKSHIQIAPKRENPFPHDFTISWEDATELAWVPQENNNG